MTVQNPRFVKKLINLIVIFGFTAVIISFSTLASSTTNSFSTTASPETSGVIN